MTGKVVNVITSTAILWLGFGTAALWWQSPVGSLKGFPVLRPCASRKILSDTEIRTLTGSVKNVGTSLYPVFLLFFSHNFGYMFWMSILAGKTKTIIFQLTDWCLPIFKWLSKVTTAIMLSLSNNGTKISKADGPLGAHGWSSRTCCKSTKVWFVTLRKKIAWSQIRWWDKNSNEVASRHKCGFYLV